MNLEAPPRRTGTRPATTGREIPHDQLDQFSPPEIRAALVAEAEALPGVFTGPSQVSEPSSLALRLHRPDGPWEAFLHPSRDEFGHIHRAGFLHLTVPLPLVPALIENGWAERHPISLRPEWPDTIVMLYAPRDQDELAVATAVLRAAGHRQFHQRREVRSDMRALAFDDFGATPALTELAVPEAAAGEVLVQVTASSVNGFDLGSVGGFLKGVYDYEFPVVVGKDFAGKVAAVGDGVTDLAVGDAVFGVVMRPTLGQGGFAEYVAVPASYGVARIPDGLDEIRAGALGLAGTAALNAVDAVAPAAGETVLISGATGGVGAFAVQFAAARGATVIATAEPGAEAAFVTALGADHTVGRDEVAAAVRELAKDGVHAAVHLAGDGATVSGLVADGGRFASTIHFAPDDADARGLKTTAIMSDPSPETLARLAGDVVAGRLRVPVARRYALAEAGQAISDFMAGTLGKFAVTV
ncbi:luciferase domain-containing protein [Actinomadura rupiterrae]|uniref:luciferase domain-containing protein n=1 Tax=Actinomadura rupiterrae TaxID=559627 RepID=UPI0020A614B0|nr:alcohol dehydrogenase catalytic domain-containing protein [Actinomadura rupiterrae]MCP2342792.1 NADPH:quinone reductase-like Zn-dependent oxidoreductase [Actinomadura rupiterrae]